MPIADKAASQAEDYGIKSDRLKEVRALIEGWKGFEKVIGSAVQFRIVVDTNVVLGDIRWLAFKRKNDTARTTLIETIEAGTIEVYAPPSLFDEVEEHIERISKEEGKDKTAMLAEWSVYQSRLRVYEPDTEKVQLLQGGADPDDAFFIALAETIGASGVVSNDRHIEKMGGNRISIDCMVSLRDYSRAAAIELNIKCAGVAFGWMSIAAVRGMFTAIKAMIDGVAKAPDWVKLSLIFGTAFCIVHPGARSRISKGFQTALKGISAATPSVLAHVADAAAVAKEQNIIAKRHLDKALEELNANESSK